MLVLSILVRDIRREISILDDIGFSGKLNGRCLSHEERLVFDGMFYAYNRVYLMIKDYCPDELF